jgi:hypothetical protein
MGWFVWLAKNMIGWQGLRRSYARVSSQKIVEDALAYVKLGQTGLRTVNNGARAVLRQ